MKVASIKGKRNYMDVYFDDGRVVRLDGEMIYQGFVADKDSIEEWKVPEGESVSEQEKVEIIKAILEKAKTSKMTIKVE